MGDWADYPKQLVCILGLMAAFAGLGLQAQSGTGVVFVDVFSGITLAQPSNPLPSIGQTDHLIVASFPAEATTQSPVLIFLQWSDDGITWKAAGAGITNVPVLTNGAGDTDVYAFQAYYGVFRSLRVNSATNTPGGAALTVKYTGTTQPSLPFVSKGADRWTF